MRRYLVFIIATLPLLLYTVSATAISVAFPDIISDLDTTVVIAGWTLTAFQLTWIAVVPLTGKITEFFGQRTVLTVSTLLFTIGSALCAIAPDIYLLIAFRVIQAVGGAAFMPCATAIISSEFPESRQRSIGLISSIFPIGMVIGPNLGGWMVDAWGWRSVFWLNVPAGIIVLLFSWLLLHGGSGHREGKIDLAGAGLLSLSLFAAMFGFTALSDAEFGISSLFSTLFIAAGIIILFLFIRRERSTPEPILDFALLRERPFLATNIYNLVYGACAIGVITLIPYFAVSVYGMSTFMSGFILTPRSVATIITSAIASFFLMRWGYRKPILVGTVVMALSLFLLALEPQGFRIMGLNLDAAAVLAVIMFISGIGIGSASPSSNNACIELMPDRVATITAVRILFRQIGSSIGILISTIVLQLMDDMSAAFSILFTGWAVVLVLSIAAVFFIPARPTSMLPPHNRVDKK